MLSSRALTCQHEQFHRELGESRQLKQDQEESCQLRKEQNPIYPAYVNWKTKFFIFSLFLIIIGSKDHIQNKNHLQKVTIGYKFPCYLVIRRERGIKYFSENVLQRKQQKIIRKAYTTDKEQLTKNKYQMHFKNPWPS